ncbi:MAG: sensor histidine kinase KdpD [Microcoleus sp. PH2017_10_PVI_O_A]|uniref:sensor histidine kinase KdpD n=1 Tax=unclassified Microcoleus TaxID=2642155 RepID=UPI001DF43DB5|nr:MULTISPECIES: sensor histidine kinase KdpD [unclassified Microcoleus]TAE82871.1 MAG: sensor histidine kinase KdpD [Oscillatoriales cyanobacterium]MCC3406086.1 sensor histidine kinase KdpD [Microcoleus sp. PH2017_10_PVI_O_A]MCC3462391.1 sensor histidine kinase KdpD [Microcoleus sp. PH2017_11_PCY_U_A]MCC3478988.1 sensor histidine kinase KdpD [Microcoleus sp. PH2017_12_PCY_D_A]MCC3529382.1 sensor histidine kinase KdpD [Microcoleus sp. PH2017_21_RUC_O_A]
MIHSSELPNNPDALYSQPNRTCDRTRRRGKHKIFIGMAPGVGKTFRMLEEGHRLKSQGIDVAVGLLETHGRKETAAKGEGLEIVPRKQMLRGEKMLTEMDTEAVIARRPQLALVDELAHTNIPGSLREKRYQDVEQILNAGIDVFSTLNIQHIESLNDLVARITGVVVRERVPDSVLEKADEIVVVDVTPETLEERLLEGKIYAPEKIEQSLENFFQRRHLIALRELALREVADNVEDDAETLKGQICNIHERVLVCVSTYPNSLQLLRRGARLANYMNAPFYAVFVSDPDRFLTKAESLHIETCEKLCKEFNGQFLRANGPHIAKAIAGVAKQYRITQIVIGESQQSRWNLLLRGSLTQKLVRSLKHVDLHIIATDKSGIPN